MNYSIITIFIIFSLFSDDIFYFGGLSMEEDIFKRSHFLFPNLLDYGFQKMGNHYFYSKNFLNDEFRCDIVVDEDGQLFCKVFDLQTEDEYTNLYVSASVGEFVNTVRNAYQNILEDIRNKCCVTSFFVSEQANRICNYIYQKYEDKPEFLWEKFPGYGVFRNKNSKKWYGAIMNIDKSKITKDSGDSGEIEILNLKLDSVMISELLLKKGFYEAYHMNHHNWITVLLDDTLTDDEIISFLNQSYQCVNCPDYWIVPANPKYYDIMHCFQDKDEILWKQSSKIHVGDIVLLYVGAPYSRIVYQCEVIEESIPYSYQDKNISMKFVMKLKLLKEFLDDHYSFSFLKDLGISSIRGPRKISREIQKYFDFYK